MVSFKYKCHVLFIFNEFDGFLFYMDHFIQFNMWTGEVRN